MLEYKILRGNDSDVQKILNQWRHEFIIEVISCNPWKEETHMLISRKNLNVIHTLSELYSCT